jgi:hypothetical protein
MTARTVQRRDAILSARGIVNRFEASRCTKISLDVLAGEIVESQEARARKTVLLKHRTASPGDIERQGIDRLSPQRR